MANVISKIFSNKVDDEVHEAFIKFSKGTFDNRYLLEAKKQKDAWAIKTSAEFANYFVSTALEKVSGKIAMKGAIISTIDMKKDLHFPIAGLKQYMGIKQNLIDTEIEPSEIRALMEKYPRAFFALSFKIPNYELKIKAKAPKSGKPSTKGEEPPAADFISLKTADSALVKDLFFDIPDFTIITISHTFLINDIVLPTGLTDPKEIREKAKRKGIIKRRIILDGKEIIKENPFLA